MHPDLIIRSPENSEELKEAYSLASSILKPKQNHPRDLNFYLDVFRKDPNYIVLAYAEKKLVGVLMSSEQSPDTLLIGELAVREDARGLGIASKLMKTAEINALKMGKKKVTLGSLDIAEDFYIKNGYTPSLFIQVDGNDRLGTLKDRFLSSIEWEKTGDGSSRLVINTKTVDKDLQASIKSEFGAHTQYLFTKDLV